MHLYLGFLIIFAATVSQALSAETAPKSKDATGSRVERNTSPVENEGGLDIFLDNLDDRLINIATDLLNVARTLQQLQNQPVRQKPQTKLGYIDPVLQAAINDSIQRQAQRQAQRG